MHTKYTTLGFILEKKGQGESSSRFSLFTRDFGKIDASAQSVRDVKSKLRMSLRDLSISEISLVRGKEMWRITGAREEGNLYDMFKGEESKLTVMANSVGLLRRLLHGEEKNEPLFDMVLGAFGYCKSEALSEEEIKNFEIVLVLNILNALGYVGNKEKFKGLMGEFVWSKTLLGEMDTVRKEALLEINRSLRESQL